MSLNIINYESIPTHSAYEIELRVRSREEQRFMLGIDPDKEAGLWGKGTNHPAKARLIGVFSTSKALLLSMFSAISQ